LDHWSQHDSTQVLRRHRVDNVVVRTVDVLPTVIRLAPSGGAAVALDKESALEGSTILEQEAKFICERRLMEPPS